MKRRERRNRRRRFAEERLNALLEVPRDLLALAFLLLAATLDLNAHPAGIIAVKGHDYRFR
jgi:hypothetical protein